MSFSIKINCTVAFNHIIIGLIEKVDSVLHTFNLHAVVTSGLDGSHGEKSLHFQGRALDFRVNDWKSTVEILAQIRKELGPDYDVIFEGNHVHIEYDPKK